MPVLIAEGPIFSRLLLYGLAADFRPGPGSSVFQ
jgi:hypothetical protein